MKRVKMNLTKELFLKEIKYNFNDMFNRQFFKNDFLKKKLKSLNIDITRVEINYFIEENNKDINVKIVRDKNNKNKYTIIFYYGFLEYFFKQAQKFSKDILNRNDKIYWTIFYYWMEIVFFHEWSHLVRNHFNLLTKSASFNEFGVNSNNLSIEKRKCLEIDADRFAGKFLAGITTLTFDELKKLLDENNNEILQIIVKLVYNLFYLLKTQSDLYPPFLLRTIILLSGLQEAKYQNEKIFNFIDLNNLEQIVIKTLMIESWLNQEDIKKIEQNINIFDKYDKCIKELLDGRS